MHIKDIVPFLAVLLVLGGVVAVAGLVVYIMLRLRAGERIGFFLRLLFRTFLHRRSVISIVFPASGASAQQQALGSPWPVSEGVRTP